MARLLILGCNRSPEAGTSPYRGTYRSHPNYQSHLDPDHEVNRVFGEFCAAGGESLVVSDIQLARKVVMLYGRLQPAEMFDVVEAVTMGEKPRFSGQLLGYDISQGGVGHSMLSWGLELSRYDSQIKGTSQWVLPIIRLSETHFRPKLNENGLFSDCQLAEFCLACLTALNHAVPSLFASEMGRYSVVALYEISRT